MKKQDHPFRDRSNRFALDQLLRDSGFSIYSRNKGREAIWLKEGELFPESEALFLVDQDKLWEAEYLMKLYFEGFE